MKYVTNGGEAVKKLLISLAATLLALFLLSACGSPTSPVPATPQAPALPEAAETAPAVAEAAVDECVVCHTDQQTLTETAKPEAEAEGESKGVG